MSSMRRLWIHLTADRRKFAMLCAAVSMGLLLWARLLVVSNYPRTALAEPVDAPAATDEGGRGAKNAALAEPQVRIALDGRVTRDPFRIDASAFPLPIEESGSRADVEKSIAEPAENQSEIARRLMARAQSLADELSIEAVMPTAALAVIDGRTIRVGETFSVGRDEMVEFLLHEVRQRSVILGVGDHRFEVSMRLPAG